VYEEDGRTVPAAHIVQTGYSALMTQDGLSSWWTPDVKANAERDSTPRFGFQPPYVKKMKITGLKPGERIEWRCIEGAEEWKGTTLTFELEGGAKESLLKAHPEMADQASQLSDAATTKHQKVPRTDQ